MIVLLKPVPSGRRVYLFFLGQSIPLLPGGTVKYTFLALQQIQTDRTPPEINTNGVVVKERILVELGTLQDT